MRSESRRLSIACAAAVLIALAVTSARWWQTASLLGFEHNVGLEGSEDCISVLCVDSQSSVDGPYHPIGTTTRIVGLLLAVLLAAAAAIDHIDGNRRLWKPAALGAIGLLVLVALVYATFPERSAADMGSAFLLAVTGCALSLWVGLGSWGERPLAAKTDSARAAKATARRRPPRG